MPEHGTEYVVYIIARYHGRVRPVYLATFYDHVDGVEDQDAFHTLADAKRWGLHLLGRKSARWTATVDAETQRTYMWSFGVDRDEL